MGNSMKRENVADLMRMSFRKGRDGVSEDEMNNLIKDNAKTDTPRKSDLSSDPRDWHNEEDVNSGPYLWLKGYKIHEYRGDFQRKHPWHARIDTDPGDGVSLGWFKTVVDAIRACQDVYDLIQEVQMRGADENGDKLRRWEDYINER